ncbi:metal-dependent hydrolase [Polaromonas sp. JS666]|uniref:metal-dependent hydrolase n=1 Tax=Polaromonas sp. (strain JS666 / ATCC BAA-500) TaxID=296591 RepID=UPI0015871FFD|nr:metal-dependent hydrolase [Polaromonas sp. JS666]
MTLASAPADTAFTGLWWNDGDAFRSRLFDGVSLLLPSGEQFVVDAVSDWLRQAQKPAVSPALRDEVNRFVREEAAHQRAHRLYNDRLAEHAPAQRLEERIASAVGEIASRSLATRLAFAAAFEQLTALLSDEILRARSPWLGHGAAPQLRLWRWHCAEEIGHRHVALDVLTAAQVSHGRRVLAMLAAVLYLAMDLTACLAAFCRHDVRSGRIGVWRLVVQGCGFAIRATPGVLRMGWGGLRYMAAPAR